MKPVSYWLDSAPAFAGAETGAVEGEVDVAVVGGGFTGLSAALALAQAGASVMVLERGRVVGAQSGRNGGRCVSADDGAGDCAGAAGVCGDGGGGGWAVVFPAADHPDREFHYRHSAPQRGAGEQHHADAQDGDDDEAYWQLFPDCAG